MNRWITRVNLGSAVMLLAPLAGMATPAYAGNPVGGCTNSYQEYSYGGVTSPYPDIVNATGDVLAGQVAPAVDGNGNHLICYKPYQNGFHNNDAGGNLVDDRSGPHS